MQEFSVKVGKKKFKARCEGTEVVLSCDGKVIRERKEYLNEDDAEHDYNIILDTLNDIGENFD